MPDPKFYSSLLLTVLLLVSFAPVAFSASDYRYLDPYGNVVELPKKKAYTRENPGPWKGFEKIHEPLIRWKTKKEGLQTVRRLLILIPHPLEKNANKVTTLYVTDKDGLIIGYCVFGPEDKILATEIRINGVINFLRLYVDCKAHGLWTKDFHLNNL